MKSFSKLSRNRLFCCVLLAFLSLSPANAQNDNDKRNAESFIDSIARTVYKLAWPTATYREISLDGFEPAENGFDVLVKISGNSYFGGGDLWMRLAFMFRDGKFYDI